MTTADATATIDAGAMTAWNRAKLIWAVLMGKRLTMNIKAANFHCTCMNDLGALMDAARKANAPACERSEPMTSPASRSSGPTDPDRA